MTTTDPGADKAVQALEKIIEAYDAYRRRGVSPAPAEYADVVAAIDAGRAALTQRQQGGVGQAGVTLELMRKYMAPWLVSPADSDDERDMLQSINAMLTAAPPAQPLSEFVRLVREAVAASRAAPVGTAVPLPPEVTAEFHKFLRDEPSAFDDIPWGEFRALVPVDAPQGPQERPALVDAMRSLLASLSREPTEQELRAAAHEFTVRADRLAVARTQREES